MSVSLDKIPGQGHRHSAAPLPSRLPRHPLYSHRDSLRRNNLVALHSALVIVALVGGTAHRGPVTAL